MATTFTAKLTLTDSGSPYSSSTSTPITLSFDYTEQVQHTVAVTASGTATVDLDAIGVIPKFFMFRVTTGAGTYVISDAGTGSSSGNLDSSGGWVMFSTGASAGTKLDKIVYTATTDSVLEVLAYG